MSWKLQVRKSKYTSFEINTRNLHWVTDKQTPPSVFGYQRAENETTDLLDKKSDAHWTEKFSLHDTF